MNKAAGYPFPEKPDGHTEHFTQTDTNSQAEAGSRNRISQGESGFQDSFYAQAEAGSQNRISQGESGFQDSFYAQEEAGSQSRLSSSSDSNLQADPESQIEQLRMEHERYQRLFRKLAQEEEAFHTANQKRIKAGIQCLIWIPMLFLALLFLTESEKVIFLLLWIVSLFLTAGFLIYIEYMDFQSQERLRRYTSDEQNSYTSLIGEDIEAFEETVTTLLRQIDERKAANRQKLLQIIGQHPEQHFPVRKESHHE